MPLATAIPVYTSRASVGVGIGATLALGIYVFARLSGYSTDNGFGDAAFWIALPSVALWLLCGVIALIADRMRGL